MRRADLLPGDQPLFRLLTQTIIGSLRQQFVTSRYFEQYLVRNLIPKGASDHEELCAAGAQLLGIV
jgi:hypothetical protein